MYAKKLPLPQFADSMLSKLDKQDTKESDYVYYCVFIEFFDCEWAVQRDNSL